MVFSSGTTTLCCICGGTLTSLEAASGRACSSLDCLSKQAIRRKALEAKAFEAKCDDLALSFAQEQDRPNHIPARVPFLDRPIRKIPAADKQVFRRNLREALRETVRRAARSTPNLIPDHDEPSSLVLNASCIACRGHCCRQGAGHAFLKPENLPSLLNRRPRDRPAVVYRDYIRRIPDSSFENSCVYHGDEGCALPRRMRTEVCNSYECEGRLRLKDNLSEAPDSASLVVAMAGTSIKAAVIAAPDQPLEWLDTPSDQD